MNNEYSKLTDRTLIVCNWCNQPSRIVWVHGHGQCSICGINIDECCQGENIERFMEENKTRGYNQENED